MHPASGLLRYALLCILPKQHRVLYLDHQQKLEPTKVQRFLSMKASWSNNRYSNDAHGLTSELNSAKTDMACDRRSGLSTGTNNSYMVSSEEVKAFWQAPNSAPMLSRNLMISWLLYFSVALKARCSTMWATPRSSSSSRTELSKCPKHKFLNIFRS